MANSEAVANINTTSGAACACQLVDLTDPRIYHMNDNSSAEPMVFVKSVPDKKKI